ncbi:hypothetical protein DFH09DRAFT_1094834 [Mycena vulgaris]|nr:hypothetical protein DFH09DRAFT_1094834 [Mycena vulgaris]
MSDGVCLGLTHYAGSQRGLSERRTTKGTYLCQGGISSNAAREFIKRCSLILLSGGMLSLDPGKLRRRTWRRKKIAFLRPKFRNFSDNPLVELPGALSGSACREEAPLRKKEDEGQNERGREDATSCRVAAGEHSPPEVPSAACKIGKFSSEVPVMHYKEKLWMKLKIAILGHGVAMAGRSKRPSCDLLVTQRLTERWAQLPLAAVQLPTGTMPSREVHVGASPSAIVPVTDIKIRNQLQPSGLPLETSQLGWAAITALLVAAVAALRNELRYPHLDRQPSNTLDVVYDDDAICFRNHEKN